MIELANSVTPLVKIGSTYGDGELDGLTVREILDQFVQAEWQTDWEAAVAQYGESATPLLMPGTPSQRRADAVTSVFERAASTPPGGKAPKPVVVIHVDHATATDILTEMEILPERDVDPLEHGRPLTTDRRCETTNGHGVDPRTAMRVALEGHIRWAIANEAGIPITWGRKRRLFTGSAADAVRSTSTPMYVPRLPGAGPGPAISITSDPTLAAAAPTPTTLGRSVPGTTRSRTAGTPPGATRRVHGTPTGPTAPNCPGSDGQSGTQPPGCV